MASRSSRSAAETGAVFESPLVRRNASAAMAELFSPRRRARTWRRLWLTLAEAQRELGLPIKAAQIRALRQAVDRIDLAAAARHERHTRHDLMAHLHAYADAAPAARPILHLGATSMDIVDNADLCILRDALRLLRDWLVNVVDALAGLAHRHRRLPCVGFTHYQPAQLTTLGKRAALWCWDFAGDLEEIDRLERGLAFRGMRGASGTQAGFLQLLDGKPARVDRLERRVAQKLGFNRIEPVTGQTYSRKHDGRVMAALAGIAASVHKFANDVRLLANLREVAEPLAAGQVGSSAMPHKRNPMLSERATGLSRYVISLSQSAWQTAAEQWLERTLDDSSNKRIIVPGAFLAADGMLQIVLHVARGLVVFPAVMKARVDAELPFLATEAVLLAAVKAGCDRQALHERLRRHSCAAAEQMYERGRPNDLLKRLKNDPAFANTPWSDVLDVKRHVGLAPRQVERFVKHTIAPMRRRFKSTRRMNPEFKV
ncbi:MAG: adenylosuccinate lyase [Phycisphaerae bacterium]